MYVLSLGSFCFSSRISNAQLDLSEKNFDGLLKWILDLRKQLSVPHTLKELINDDSRFEEMSIMAFNDPSTGGNPIQLTDKDFFQLYNNSYYGKL